MAVKIGDIKFIKLLQHKREELGFYVSKKKIKKEIQKYLHSKIILKPVLTGNGYTTKYVILAKGKKYFLKVANKFAEERIKKVSPMYYGDYVTRLTAESQILKLLSLKKLAPRPLLKQNTFLLMDYVNGLPLSTIFADRNIPMRIKMQYLNRILLIINSLHLSGVIWPDLSPTNILIYEDKFYFIDFELCFNAGVSVDQKIIYAVNRYIFRLFETKLFYTEEVYASLKEFISKYPRDIKERLLLVVERFENGNS